MFKLLLVDDVRTTLAMEKAFLEARGLKVFTSTSAREALELAAAVQPDLVIVDYEMPDMNGDVVCRRLKADPKTSRIPVLVLSSHEDEEIIARCRAAGAADFAKKKEGRDGLLDHVSRLLALPRRQHVRVPCLLSIGIESESQRIRGSVHNISRSGAYLTVDRPLAQGKAVRLTMKLLDDQRPIELLGEIVRSETLGDSLYGYGVQFLEADADSLRILKEFIGKTV